MLRPHQLLLRLRVAAVAAVRVQLPVRHQLGIAATPPAAMSRTVAVRQHRLIAPDGATKNGPLTNASGQRKSTPGIRVRFAIQYDSQYDALADGKTP
jgi:hypothetical protein